MSGPGQEFVEVFLQEASEHLQFLREYSGILLDPYPSAEDVELAVANAPESLKSLAQLYGVAGLL